MTSRKRLLKRSKTKKRNKRTRKHRNFRGGQGKSALRTSKYDETGLERHPDYDESMTGVPKSLIGSYGAPDEGVVLSGDDDAAARFQLKIQHHDDLKKGSRYRAPFEDPTAQSSYRDVFDDDTNTWTTKWTDVGAESYPDKTNKVSFGSTIIPRTPLQQPSAEEEADLQKLDAAADAAEAEATDAAAAAAAEVKAAMSVKAADIDRTAAEAAFKVKNFADKKAAEAKKAAADAREDSFKIREATMKEGAQSYDSKKYKENACAFTGQTSVNTSKVLTHKDIQGHDKYGDNPLVYEYLKSYHDGTRYNGDRSEERQRQPMKLLRTPKKYYGCDDQKLPYIVWNPELHRYCCGSKPDTAQEVLDFTEMWLRAYQDEEANRAKGEQSTPAEWDTEYLLDETRAPYYGVGEDEADRQYSNIPRVPTPTHKNYRNETAAMYIKAVKKAAENKVRPQSKVPPPPPGAPPKSQQQKTCGWWGCRGGNKRTRKRRRPKKRRTKNKRRC